MTPKQATFVREYLIDMNATQAALRAGYSEKTAGRRYYTYALIDARDGSIFYVGKGKGGRIKSHVRAARSGREVNGAKASKIRDIISAGISVCEFIIEDGMTETDALAFEKSLIAALAEHGLTNISGGNISAAESLYNRIRHEAQSTRPFEVWAQLPETAWIKAVVELWGSKRNFYDWYVGEFDKLSNIQKALL